MTQLIRFSSSLKSSEYVINQIRDITNSNDVHFSDVLLKDKRLLLMVF